MSLLWGFLVRRISPVLSKNVIYDGDIRILKLLLHKYWGFLELTFSIKSIFTLKIKESSSLQG